MQFTPNPNYKFKSDVHPCDDNFYANNRKQRVEMCIVGNKLPLQWEGFTNEFIHAINDLRKKWNCGVTDKISIKVNLTNEDAYTALLYEQEWIKQECLLSDLTLRKTVARPDSKELELVRLELEMYDYQKHEDKEKTKPVVATSSPISVDILRLNPKD